MEWETNYAWNSLDGIVDIQCFCAAQDAIVNICVVLVEEKTRSIDRVCWEKISIVESKMIIYTNAVYSFQFWCCDVCL